MPRLARASFERFGFATATLLTDWDQIVGPALARMTSPERLRWPRQTARAETDEGPRPGAVLVLAVEPARALDVQYSAAQIIDRINGYFGYQAVSSIRIEQRPLGDHPRAQEHSAAAPPRIEKPREAIAVEDERLRRALERLSSGVAARSLTSR